MANTTLSDSLRVNAFPADAQTMDAFAPFPSKIGALDHPADKVRNDSVTTADMLEVGSVARVLHVSANCSELRQKLLSLGVVQGTLLSVTGVAPLKDPMNIHLLGFTLSLRRCEAHCITVERVAGDNRATD